MSRTRKQSSHSVAAVAVRCRLPRACSCQPRQHIYIYYLYEQCVSDGGTLARSPPCALRAVVMRHQRHLPEKRAVFDHTQHLVQRRLFVENDVISFRDQVYNLEHLVFARDGDLTAHDQVHLGSYVTFAHDYVAGERPEAA